MSLLQYRLFTILVYKIHLSIFKTAVLTSKKTHRITVF
jgi:hypothetical protein